MNVLTALKGLHQAQPTNSNPTIQLVLGQQTPPQDDMFKKMMMKMMMRKMFKEEHSPFGYMGGDKGSDENKGFDILKMLANSGRNVSKIDYIQSKMNILYP